MLSMIMVASSLAIVYFWERDQLLCILKKKKSLCDIAQRLQTFGFTDIGRQTHF